VRRHTRLIIDLKILHENFIKLKKRCCHNEIIFMVKANGYGHGLLPLTRYAIESIGIGTFGVASLPEALYLKNELKDLDFDIWVFSDINLDDDLGLKAYEHNSIQPVISSLSCLKIFLSQKIFKNFPLVLKINTGMNRLGISASEWEAASKMILDSGRKSIQHLMSHFANSSFQMESDELSQTQLRQFADGKNLFRAKGISIEATSISNSGAILQNIGLGESHVRPGLILYGPSTLNKNLLQQFPWEGRCVSSLKANVIQVFHVNKGEPVGYSGTLTPAAGSMAILAAGYGDGLPTVLKNSVLSSVAGNPQIHGKINMDMLQLFFPDSCGKKVVPGQEIELWGHDQDDLLNLANQSGLIPYELLCLISDRVPREYHY